MSGRVYRNPEVEHFQLEKRKRPARHNGRQLEAGAKLGETAAASAVGMQRASDHIRCRFPSYRLFESRLFIQTPQSEARHTAVSVAKTIKLETRERSGSCCRVAAQKQNMHTIASMTILSGMAIVMVKRVHKGPEGVCARLFVCRCARGVSYFVSAAGAV